MNVSAAYIQEFVKKLDALDANAKQVYKIETSKRNLEQRLSDGEAEAFQEVVDVARAVVAANSRVASALSAQYYDGIREASKVKSKYRAESYDTVDDDDLQSAYFAVGKDYSSGRATVPLYSLMGDTSTRFTRYASNETVRRNAAKDPAKPKFAIYASPSACAFCQMRAGLGYQYPSESEVESHNHCKCQAVQVYGKSGIQGYDPGAYEEKYFEAKRALDNGEISDELEYRIKEAKRRHDEKYAQAIAEGKKMKKWDKTNEILMVWREREGIK